MDKLFVGIALGLFAGWAAWGQDSGADFVRKGLKKGGKKAVEAGKSGFKKLKKRSEESRKEAKEGTEKLAAAETAGATQAPANA